MDNLFIILFVTALVIGAIGSVLWWILVVWLVKKGVDAMQADLTRTERVMRSYLSASGSARVQMRPEVLSLLSKANTQLRQMDASTVAGGSTINASVEPAPLPLYMPNAYSLVPEPRRPITFTHARVALRVGSARRLETMATA